MHVKIEKMNGKLIFMSFLSGIFLLKLDIVLGTGLLERDELSMEALCWESLR